MTYLHILLHPQDLLVRPCSSDTVLLLVVPMTVPVGCSGLGSVTELATNQPKQMQLLEHYNKDT